MKKLEFLAQLQKGLYSLPKADIDERLTFYSEIIDDRMEDGLSEEDAVSEVGAVENIILQILNDTPITYSAKQIVKPKSALRVWEILLLVLGSPIWLSLIIAAFAVILSVYVLIWSLIISLWAIFASLIGSALGGVASGLILICYSNRITGIALVGVGIVCAGLSIFLFYGCYASTKGTLLLTKKIALKIKNCFVKRETE